MSGYSDMNKDYEIEHNRIIKKLEEIQNVIEEDKQTKLRILNLLEGINRNHFEFNIKKELELYEQNIKEVLRSKDKNIRFLSNRLAVIEQSTKFQLGSALIDMLKNPLMIPSKVFSIIRMSFSGAKQKINRTKKTYRLPTLPYVEKELPKIPKLSFRGNSEDITANNHYLNELFLLGLNHPKSVLDLKVAAILDEFSTFCFKPECNLITFNPDNWREVLTLERPHLLLVESAWNGNGGAWQYKVAKYNIRQGSELDDLLSWCNERNIPTVFWNKEDPVHFEKFLPNAKKFDIILTSDEKCIENYKKHLNHEKVYALPFAAQPSLHNPTRIKGYKQKEICFAGSYYANRHAERRRDMEILLDSVLNMGLEIFDRNYNRESKDFRFPDRYKPYVKGNLPYDKLIHAYKQYKLFLNVNSVTDSKTMFSRRIFELLACGTTVLSTYSFGIKKMFHDIVLMTDHRNTVELANKALSDVTWRKKNELLGIREVFKQHTYSHRLYEIAKYCGYELEKPYRFQVAFIGIPENKRDIQTIISMFKKQTYSNVTLYLLLNGDIYSTYIEKNKEKNIKVIKSTRSIDLKEIENVNKFNYIGIISPRHFYANNYTLDLINALIYSDADIVGKGTFFEFDAEKSEINLINGETDFTYTYSILPEAALFSTTWLQKMNLSLTDFLNREDVLLATRCGAVAYSADRYNFIKDFDLLDAENFSEKVKAALV